MIRKLHMNRLGGNRSGGIEGLPLQLMMVILIATLGTAVIIGWMGSLETPQRIGSVNVESGGIELGGASSTDSAYAKIYVTDQNGNGLGGATVLLVGCGASTADGKSVYGTTDVHGYAEFSGFHVKLSNGKPMDSIRVEVTKSGYGSNSTASIVVIR